MSSKTKNVWKIAKVSDLKEDLYKFKKVRTKLKSVLRKEYRYFVDNLGEMSKSNPRRFWSFFRNKTKSKSLPSKIQNDSAGSTDQQGKACLFTDYFKSIFKQVDKREQDQLPDIPIICDDHLSSMCFNDFDVFKISSKLDVNKACGPDNVSPYVLKMYTQQITPSQVFFNLSMRLSQVPNMWKCAYVSPIHEKGDRDKVNNYRPVSLLRIVSNIMESCIYNHIYNFVSRDISEKQHVFFSDRSCYT